MRITRRTLLSSLSALALHPLLPVGCSSAAPKLGLIFPPAGRGVPEEGIVMYGKRIEFVTEALGLKTMTPEGYEAVIDRIPPAAKSLVQRGAQAVVLMGTSLSFFKGEAYNQRLTNALKDATGGLPVTTMSTAVIQGLKKVGAHRIAAPTGYNEDVNGRLRSFLTEHGFEVLIVEGLGVEAVEDINRITQPQLLDFCTKVVKSAPKADAVLVSCGGLRTLEIIAPLEENTGLPVVTSTPHALMAGARLVGLDARVPGYGRLLGMG